jgi:hypothetical protein
MLSFELNKVLKENSMYYIIVATIILPFSLVYGSEGIISRLEGLVKNYQYTQLKEYLKKEEVRKCIKKEKLLFPELLTITDNPLMIKLFIDNGINLNYYDQDTKKTIFHLIVKKARLINEDIIIPLIARFITTKKDDELFLLYQTLNSVVDKQEIEDYTGKTAYQKAYAKEKKQLTECGRPYFHVDPLVEIILYNQDQDFLTYGIDQIVQHKNSVQSEQNFNIFKSKTLFPPKKYIHNKATIDIVPTIATALLNESRWRNYFINGRINTKILTIIQSYRHKNGYDQFPIAQTKIPNTGVNYKKRLYSCPPLICIRKNTTTAVNNEDDQIKSYTTTPMVEQVAIWDPLSNNLCEINADNNL